MNVIEYHLAEKENKAIEEENVSYLLDEQKKREVIKWLKAISDQNRLISVAERI